MNSIIVGLICLGVGYFAPKIVAKLNKSVKNIQPTQSGQETFSATKLVQGFTLLNPVAWAKRLVSAFWNFVIYGVIIAVIFTYGYTVGNKGKPVSVNLGYGREAIVKISNTEYMHITKSGEVHIQDNADDKKAKTIRVLTVKDIGTLQSKLSPIGFQLRPVAVVGYGLGIGQDGGIEGGIETGAGISFFRYWQGSVEAFLTQKGVYVGTSYRLDRLHLENTSVGIAIGKGYNDFQNNDIRVMVYGIIRF